MEVEEMINKVREQQGRPFDMRQLITSCVANVIMNVLFGHRFDHSDPTFQQVIHDLETFFATFFPVLEIFPALRFLPYFKNKIVGHLSSAKNIESFVINNIATCTEVCDYFSQDVSIACYADVLSSLSHRCLSSVCGDVTLLF